MRRGRLVGLLVLTLSSSAVAQGPSADWLTLSTPHFRVHYPRDFAAFARHTAESLEGAYPRVAERVGWAPALPIDVIIRDPRAAANGAAVPWLDRPEIVVWAFPPDAESSTGRFSDWVEVLSVHELAHVAHLGRPGTGPLGALARFSPAPLGPLALRAPRWVYEGYATLIEGELTGSGRPGSVFRAMVVRRLALDDELPPYGKLSSTRGWLSGSVAYLVGSAYLEWLAQREGRDRLPELWRAMEEWRGFEGAFRSVFGRSPKDLYAAFVADMKARALEEEKRLESAGLVEGDLWLRLEGGTASVCVSPDGTKLLARRDASPRSSVLSVWEIAGDATEAPPRWTLPRANGFSASDPRWMPDSKDALFARRAPGADGALVWDLYRWTLATGAVRRVTRGAGVADADPSPDGRFAVAVRNRFGISALVTVDLATGAVTQLPVAAGSEDAWLVWNHPRFSPDGRRIAALLHRDGRWRLVTLSAQGGAITELPLPGEPVAQPAWSPDGARIWVAADGSGIWNLYEVDPGGGAVEARTRVMGGAFSPAPAPDGRSLFFLDFTAKGVNVRRLDLETSRPVALGVVETPAAFPPRLWGIATATEHPYDVWRRMAVRSLVGFSVGPSGGTVQVGVDGGDAVGRLHWLAAGSFGNAAGPRGGALAAAWRSSALEASGTLFSAIEKPGSQSLAPRPELDQERTGGYLGLSWGRPFFWGAVRAEAGGGATRVEAFSSGDRFWRSLGATLARVSLRRTRGGFGFGLDAEALGSAGTTSERFWRQAAGGARLSGLTPFASLAAGARTGATGGSPTVFDVFSIGGASATILPEGLDRNRIESAALPAAVQLGERFESFRCELELDSFPLVFYGEWLRAWSAGGERPPAVRVTGAEVRLERLIPPEVERRLTLRVGLGYVSSNAPRIRATRGYAALVYRP